MGASLILEKFFSRSSFYDIASFSTPASGPHLDATITSENISRSSSIDTIVSLVDLLYGCFSCFRGLFQQVQDPAYIRRLNSCSFRSYFGWSTIRNFSQGPVLSIGPFQKVQHEVIYFPCVVIKNGNPLNPP